MTLKELENVLGSGETIRICTEHGKGWLVDTTNIHLDEWDRYDEFFHREVTNVYTSDGRDVGSYTLAPAVCIIVNGYENGHI